MEASAEPPRRVKSSPAIDDRPAVHRAAPEHAIAGDEGGDVVVGVVVALPAMAPISWNLPGSSMRSIRSRTVSRPPACWRATRSAPPMLVRGRRGGGARRVRLPGGRGGRAGYRCIVGHPVIFPSSAPTGDTANRGWLDIVASAIFVPHTETLQQWVQCLRMGASGRWHAHRLAGALVDWLAHLRDAAVRTGRVISWNRRQASFQSNPQ